MFPDGLVSILPEPNNAFATPNIVFAREHTGNLHMLDKISDHVCLLLQ